MQNLTLYILVLHSSFSLSASSITDYSTILNKLYCGLYEHNWAQYGKAWHIFIELPYSLSLLAHIPSILSGNIIYCLTGGKSILLPVKLRTPYPLTWNPELYLNWSALSHLFREDSCLTTNFYLEPTPNMLWISALVSWDPVRRIYNAHFSLFLYLHDPLSLFLFIYFDSLLFSSIYIYTYLSLFTSILLSPISTSRLYSPTHSSTLHHL